MNGKRPEPPALAPLMPLRTAAVAVYRSINKRTAETEGMLNNVARLIASRTRIFTRDGDEEPALVMPDEIVEGHFEEGGAVLRFFDGRAPLPNLAIRHSSLEHVMSEIRRLYDDQS